MANFSPYSLIHPFLLLEALCSVQSPPEQEETHNLKQTQGVPIKKQHRILGFLPKTNQTGEWVRRKLATTEVKLLHKGGNLDCTSRVICVCWYQISRFFNFGGHFYYSNFSSWSNESALRFFDFALFHGQNQVLSLFVTFRHFFNNNLDCTSRVLCTRGHEN